MNERDYINEIIESDDRIYNLTLYLSYIRDHYPAVFEELDEHFEGMPGLVFKPEA